MKQKLTVVLLIITIGLSAQTFNKAVDYLDFIGEKQTAITKNSWKYTKAVAHSKRTSKIRKRRKVVIKSIDKAIKTISVAGTYGNGDFKTKVINNLKLQKIIMEKDYSKIIDMKEIAENSYDLMEAYFLAKEMAEKKLKEGQLEYETSFYAYANKHQINIVESKSDLSKKMKISAKVFKHYNEMYLIFFKVSFNEKMLIDAIKNNDVSGIQQYANALSEEAKSGLKKLDTVTLYKKDKSLVDMTKKAFDFYIEESETKVPILIDFLLLNDNFSKIKKTIDKTPQRKRTKEQVNSFNKMVKEMNNGVKKFNKTNTELNNKRANIINNYNAVNERFLSTHIPND